MGPRFQPNFGGRELPKCVPKRGEKWPPQKFAVPTVPTKGGPKNFLNPREIWPREKKLPSQESALSRTP